MFSLLAVFLLGSFAGAPQAQAKPAAFAKPAADNPPTKERRSEDSDEDGGRQADPREDPAVTELARKIYLQMREGRIDAMLMTPEMNESLRPSVLGENKPLFEKLGVPTSLTVERRERSLAGTKYEYLVTFPNAQMHVRIFVAKDGRVAGYSLAP